LTTLNAPEYLKSKILVKFISIIPTVLSPQWVTAMYLLSFEQAIILGNGPVGITRTISSFSVSIIASADGLSAWGSKSLL
jgi:hypothetical protein